MNRSKIIPDLAHCRRAADFVKNRIHGVPEIGLLLGSGLGPLAQHINIKAIIPYGEIPGFPLATAPLHTGRLIYGELAGVKILCMQGRFHFYEGYEFEELAMSIRVLKLLGIRLLLQTNAAGAVNLDYKPGDVMILNDHINLPGINPCRGQLFKEFGERFYAVTNLYTEELRKIALKVAENSRLTFHEGAYMFFPGPNYETAAEIRAARLLGADAVGMSTVPEALTAGQLGLPQLALSVMTNMGAGIRPTPLTPEEVSETAEKISSDFSAYVEELLAALKKEFLEKL